MSNIATGSRDMQKGHHTSTQPRCADIHTCPGLHQLSCRGEANGSHQISHASGVIHSTPWVGCLCQSFHSAGLIWSPPAKQNCSGIRDHQPLDYLIFPLMPILWQTLARPRNNPAWGLHRKQSWFIQCYHQRSRRRLIRHSAECAPLISPTYMNGWCSHLWGGGRFAVGKTFVVARKHFPTTDTVSHNCAEIRHGFQHNSHRHTVH